MKTLTRYSEILKHLPRSGWVHKNISNPETVAAHSWQMSLLAIYLAKDYGKEYDFEKVIKLCICHDLGESMIGDITPKEEAYKNKPSQELSAIRKLSSSADFPELLSLFEEFELKQTKEAMLATDLDAIDMYIQAKDYVTKYPKTDLTEFFQSAERKIKTALGKKLLSELKA